MKKFSVYITILLVIFFAIGLKGLLDPAIRDHFIGLFPLALLISILVILIFAPNKFSIRFFSVFILIAATGFLIELAGVYTSLIFGDYSYGNTLGYKILDTPVIIGLNWAMLVYATSSVSDSISLPVAGKILTGSFMMVAYDLLLEVIAPVLGMWTFENGIAPLRNYFAWFIISVIFHSLIRLLKVKTRSATALPVLIIHVIFFICLIIFL